MGGMRFEYASTGDWVSPILVTARKVTPFFPGRTDRVKGLVRKLPTLLICSILIVVVTMIEPPDAVVE